MSEAPGREPPIWVLVAGECLVDLAPAPPSAVPASAGGGGGGRQGPAWGRHFVAFPGGSPANVAVGLARLRTPTKFAGRFSTAGFGPWLRAYLSANGVDMSLCVDAAQPATLAAVTLDGRGRASYTFYGPETADWHWSFNELPGVRGPTLSSLGVAAVHTGSIATAFEPSATLLRRWVTEIRRGGEVVISLDPNIRPALVHDLEPFKARLEKMVSSAHIVKASDEDVNALYGHAAPGDVSRRWLGTGASLVIITEGEDGATAFHHSGLEVSCRPPPVPVVDTIGAGDAFTAGLLAYLGGAGLLSPGRVSGLSEAQLEAALDQAVTTSALTCSRAGADPPGAEELVAFRDGRRREC